MSPTEFNLVKIRTRYDLRGYTVKVRLIHLGLAFLNWTRECYTLLKLETICKLKLVLNRNNMEFSINGYEELYDLLNESKKKFCAFDGFVKIEIPEGKDRYEITKVYHSFPFFGYYDEGLLEEELSTVELDQSEITKEGCYGIHGIASIHMDDNGVGHEWTYLEFDYYNVIYALTINEYENPDVGNDMSTDCLFDFLDPDKSQSILEFRQGRM